MLKQFCDSIELATEWIGRAISWLTLLMVVVTFVIVVLRYAFDLGWIAMQESVVYFHAFVFMLAASYTLKHDGHVRVDIFYRNYSLRAKALVDMLGALFLLLPVCAFVFINSLDNVVDAWRRLEGSEETGGLDLVFALKSAMLIMPLLVALQGLAIMARSFLHLKGGDNG